MCILLFFQLQFVWNALSPVLIWKLQHLWGSGSTLHIKLSSLLCSSSSTLYGPIVCWQLPVFFVNPNSNPKPTGKWKVVPYVLLYSNSTEGSIVMDVTQDFSPEITMLDREIGNKNHLFSEPVDSKCGLIYPLNQTSHNVKQVFLETYSTSPPN